MGSPIVEQVAMAVLPGVLNVSIDLGGWKLMVKEKQELSAWSSWR
jgi:hypothetical protein